MSNAAAVVEAIKARHVERASPAAWGYAPLNPYDLIRVPQRSVCAGCRSLWPCETRMALDALVGQVALLRGTLASVEDWLQRRFSFQVHMNQATCGCTTCQAWRQRLEIQAALELTQEGSP